MQLSLAQLTGQDDAHLQKFVVKQNSHYQTEFQLLPTAGQALTKLIQAAAQDNLYITVLSSFRSFARQLTLWNEKFAGLRTICDENGKPLNQQTLTEEEKVQAMLRWSAIPGTSRHHWGTDVDIFDHTTIHNGHQVELIPAEFATGGVCADLHQWLAQHCQQFDFYRPYHQSNHQSSHQNNYPQNHVTNHAGIAPEAWHLSYQPLANNIKSNLSIDCLRQLLQQQPIAGKAFLLNNLTAIHQQYIANY